MMDKWKKAVDNHKVFGAVLTDLSKEFECICHDLLLAKPNVNGLSLPALKLITDYLQNGKQRTKIGSIYSYLNYIISGVPQASILGPLLFNILYVTFFLKMKIIILEITLMIPPHTLLVALQQKC